MDVRYLFFFKQKTAYEVRISGWSSDVCSSDLFFWHLDGMPMANIAPPKASVLSCRKKSPTGGQTQFASTFAAYDALSDEEKAEYEKLTVVHSLVAGVREVKDAAELQPHMRSRRAARPLGGNYPPGERQSGVEGRRGAVRGNIGGG